MMSDSIDYIQFKVDAKRLSWGLDGSPEGDVHSSYSADLIPSGKIRHPFRFDGNLSVTVSMSRYEGVESAEAYKLIPENLFRGPPTTYSEKVAIDGGEAARNDPNGFYNGVRVSFKSAASILTGPPVRFVADPERPDSVPEPEQMSLFS